MSYELCVLTMNGVIIGIFDDPTEANGLYKFAKENKYDIVTRKIDECNGGKILAEKRFVENESIFKSGLEPSIDSLKGTLFRMEMDSLS